MMNQEEFEWRIGREKIESKIGDLKRVYADLNKLDGDEIPLTTLGTVWDLAYHNLELSENIRLPMWTDDGDKDGIFDPILFTAIIKRSPEGIWYAQINREELIHFSDSKQQS